MTVSLCWIFKATIKLKEVSDAETFILLIQNYSKQNLVIIQQKKQKQHTLLSRVWLYCTSEPKLRLVSICA